MDGELDERRKETKIRIEAGAGLRGDLYRLFRPGFRGQNPGFATTQRRHSPQSNAYSDSRAACNSARQPAGDHDISGDADPNAPPDRRTNSD